MRTKFYNKDIASQLANDISVTSLKDELHLSSFIPMPVEIKHSIIEAIANAQIDYIKESMTKQVPILTIPYVGRFTYSVGRVLAQELFASTAMELFDTDYRQLSNEQKATVRLTCKPIIISKVIENTKTLRTIPPKSRNNSIKVSSFIKKPLL